MCFLFRINFSLLIIISCVICINFGSNGVKGSKHWKPEIFDAKGEKIVQDLFMKTNERLKLICRGFRPIKWKEPFTKNPFCDEDTEKNVKINNGTYELLLEKTVTVENTGFYKCAYVDKVIKIDNITSVYVYVQDNNHLLVPLQIFNDGVISKTPIIYGDKNGRIVFPCRPTNPRIVVTLYHNDIEIPIKSNFHPKVGFKFTNVSDGDYTCKSRTRNRTDELQFKYKGLVLEPEVGPSMVNHDDISHIGKQLTLICTVNVPAEGNYKLLWKLPPNLSCLDKRLKIINATIDIEMNNRRKMTSRLILSNLTIPDSNMYECLYQNNSTTDKFNILPFYTVPKYVKVVDPDLNVILDGPNVVFPNETNTFNCIAEGKIIPNIYWTFETFTNDTLRPYKTELSGDLKTFNSTKATSSVSFKTSLNGNLTCFASTSKDSYDIKLKMIYVTDVLDGFQVWKSIENVSVGDTVVLYCGVLNMKPLLKWYLNDSKTPIVSNQKYILENESTPYSYREKIILKNITKKSNGNYRCEKQNGNKVLKIATISLTVLDPEAPTIYESNLKKSRSEITKMIEDPFEFYCYSSGLPKPTTTWTKNNKTWVPSSERIIISKGNQSIKFSSTKKDDEGIYCCVAQNRKGQEIQSARLIIDDTPVKTPLPTGIIITIVLLTTLLGVILICSYLKLRHDKKVAAELEAIGLQHFEKGDIKCINPDLIINDQIDLLPYYDDWEFARENLKLGKVLGAGAFGIVMKAEAYGILTGEDCTIVAVKTIKKNSDIATIKALVTELKIMTHLGHNVNVVNLMGACTKNVVSKRELYLIMEYCRFGNVLNYLRRHRKGFINQIDPLTNEINPTIGAKILCKYRETCDDINDRRFSRAYLCRQNSEPPPTPTESIEIDYRMQSVSMNTDSIYSTSNQSQGEYIPMLGNTSQSDNRSSYKGGPLCTEDLLCWAFQVARGMEYLVSRHVLHGDLAARNILLADNNIVKICDFGLAKSMYKDANYVKNKNGPLPIKWMALESIRDGIFSIQSDIWSYGIVLWEFFSLGHEPYPGLVVNETFYQQLEDGYRLSKPDYASRNLYQIMKQCWDYQPNGRPSFSKLSDDLGQMLNCTKREHFINLNSSYVLMNQMKLNAGTTSDYLSMVKNPDFNNLSSSVRTYVNTSQAINLSTSEYLVMSGNKHTVTSV